MHELSIAMSIVEMAEEESDKRAGARVTAVHLKLGALSGVVKQALLSSYDLACEGTALQGSRLLVEEIPVRARCPNCRAERAVDAVNWFVCPDCGAAASELLQGRELEVTALEIRIESNRRVWSKCVKTFLKKNDLAARALRERFRQAGVFVVSLVSSPGSGKTAFLEKTLTMLRPDRRVAALVGDLETENDAMRLARSGAPVKQIVTGTVCHLEAAMIENAIEPWDLNNLDFLFIENVGNLVCPSSYDLGENMRLVLLSVTEGEDKPLKYPTIFNTADVAAITKMDLAAAVEFDCACVEANIQKVRPGMRVFKVSTKTGLGIASWLDFLHTR